MTPKPTSLVDTHCHIHDDQYDFDTAEVLHRAKAAGVEKMICVGTDLRSSLQAVEFCEQNKGCYFSLALHPHETAGKTEAQIQSEFKLLRDLAIANAKNSKFVAVGECGLDYFYHKDNSIRKLQAGLLTMHLDLAKMLDKPMIFHVREAFTDFWPIYDHYNCAGVVHSFSGTSADMKQILKRQELYIGLNGIMTFSTDKDQLNAAKLIPLEKLLLETDSPYLTPRPLRGKINQPENVRLVAEFLSDLRTEAESLLVDQTTTNAHKLFSF